MLVPPGRLGAAVGLGLLSGEGGVMGGRRFGTEVHVPKLVRTPRGIAS